MKKSKKYLVVFISIMIVLFIGLIIATQKSNENNAASEIEYVDTYEKGTVGNPSDEDMEIINKQHEEKEGYKQEYEENADYVFKLSNTLPDKIDDSFGDAYIIGRDGDNIDEIKKIVQTIADNFHVDVATLQLVGTEYYTTFKEETYLISDGIYIYETLYNQDEEKVYITVTKDDSVEENLVNTEEEETLEIDNEYSTTEEDSLSNFTIEKVD